MIDSRKKEIHLAAERLKGVYADVDCIERDLKRVQREEQRILDNIPKAQRKRLDVLQASVAVSRMETARDALSEILDKLETIITSLEGIK